MTKISDLEGVVLGLVQRHGPCTAYRIRQTLGESPSSHWTASAGAIYPLISRLVGAGLVASKPDPEDGRGRTLLTLTSKGGQALRVFLLQVSDPQVASAVFDGVRARAFFLDCLTDSDRAQFAAEALRALESFLEQATAYADKAEAEGDTLQFLAARGGLLAARARVEWMREVADAT